MLPQGKFSGIFLSVLLFSSPQKNSTDQIQTRSLCEEALYNPYIYSLKHWKTYN